MLVLVALGLKEVLVWWCEAAFTGYLAMQTTEEKRKQQKSNTMKIRENEFPSCSAQMVKIIWVFGAPMF